MPERTTVTPPPPRLFRVRFLQQYHYDEDHKQFVIDLWAHSAEDAGYMATLRMPYVSGSRPRLVDVKPWVRLRDL